MNADLRQIPDHFEQACAYNEGAAEDYQQRNKKMHVLSSVTVPRRLMGSRGSAFATSRCFQNHFAKNAAAALVENCFFFLGLRKRGPAGQTSQLRTNRLNFDLERKPTEAQACRIREKHDRFPFSKRTPIRARPGRRPRFLAQPRRL